MGISYKCDVCGKERCPGEVWWKIEVSPLPMKSDGDPIAVMCSQRCTMKAREAWQTIAGIRSAAEKQQA